MPFVEDQPEKMPVGRGAMGVEPPAPDVEAMRAPGWQIGLSAAQQYNSVFSALHAFKYSGPFKPVEGYNPLDDLPRDSKYYQYHADQFIGSQSPEETAAKKRQIDEEDFNNRIIGANGMVGSAASMAAGMLDPMVAFVPGSIALEVTKGGAIAARAAKIAAGGAGGAVQAGAQEAALQATQATRTKGESALNIASNTILTGLIGYGALKFLTPAEHAKLVQAVNAERQVAEAHVTGEPPASKLTLEAPTELGKPYVARDRDGKVIAQIYATVDRDVAHISDIVAEGATREDPLLGKNTLGPSAVRSLLRQFQKMYPEVERITADRISGARLGGEYDLRGGTEMELKLRPETALEKEATGLATAGGAAATDTREMKIVGFGLDKVPGLSQAIERMSPMQRLLRSGNMTARRVAGDAADTALALEQHAHGVPTSQFGASLERVAQTEITKAQMAFGRDIDRAYASYRYGDPDTSMVRGWATIDNLLGRNEGKMTLAEFKAEAAKATLMSDKHDIPEVQLAAESWRRNIANPTLERAIAAGVFNEIPNAKPDQSWLYRVWNKKAIAADRPGVRDRFANWLGREQERKRDIRNQLEPLKKKLTNAERKLKRLMTEGEADESMPKTVEAHAEVAKLRADVEELLGQWHGKTAKEAVAAIKARQKAMAERQEGAPRLEAADKPVDEAVNAILRKDLDVDPLELKDRAEQIIDRIISGPDGRLPYDTESGGPIVGGTAPRGPLAARQFMIPSLEVFDLLEQDIEKVAHKALRTVWPDILASERFGDRDWSEVFRKLNEESRARVEGAKTEKERIALEKERQDDIRDIAGIRDRLHGTFGWNPNAPTRQLGRIMNSVKAANVPLMMGNALVGSLADMAGAVFRWGMTDVFKEAWAPFFAKLTGQSEFWTKFKEEARAMGFVNEIHAASRHHAMNDIADDFGQGNRLERTLQWTASKFQFANGLAMWTDWAKTTAAAVGSYNIRKAAKAVVDGNASAKQLATLAEGGIDPAMARRVFKMFEEHSDVIDGHHLPNTADWTDKGARSAFENALARDANIRVVTPGQEKPFLMSDPTFSVLTQFKTFQVAATERILIANLQQRDAATLQGLIFTLGLGMLSYKIKSVLGGQPTSDNPGDWFKEAVSNSGITGWLEEGNAMASKTSRGTLDVYRILGADKPLSRYASRSALDQLLGPTAGRLEKLQQITGAGAKRDWKASDTHALRTFIAGQNLPYLRGLLNQVEHGANSAFGIPEKTPTP